MELNKELIIVFLEKGFSIDFEYTKKDSIFINEQLVSELKKEPYKTLFYFGFKENKVEMSESLSFLHYISSVFIKSISQDPDIEFTRTPKEIQNDELLKIFHRIPFVIGIEYINATWIKMIWSYLIDTFKKEIENYDGTISEFLLSQNTNIAIVGRVFFHLVENKSEDYPFAFLATYSTGTQSEKKAKHLPLKNALIEYKNEDELLLKLLSTVSKAADKSEFISEIVESGEIFSPLQFTSSETYNFLKEIPLYEECGVLCRIPDWWKKRTNSLKVSLSVGEAPPSVVGMDALLSFSPSIYFGDLELTKEDIKNLLSQTNGLSFLKGKWVEVDKEKLQETLDALEKIKSMSSESGFTLADAMRLQLGLKNNLGIEKDDDIISVSNGKWLSTIKDKLLNPEKIKNLDAGSGFKANLRAYQQTGFDWLATMKTLGFGALLADDMGLGKTVQILALLEYLNKKTKSKFKALLIIPASLIGNWQQEIEKFTPSLKYTVLHAKATDFHIDQANLFITTYGMAVRLESLKEQKWDLVILDEAQAIKNPGTKQTKSVKLINADFKIAMTGTPVENRLSDLWSLFDFLNSGLLGTAKEFTDFSKKLANEDSYSKLRDVISPFILRRLKTDKSIINDLPDKVEIKAYATLTKKQVVLYNKLVKELSAKIISVDGIERKGIVLSSIMKFKQICNHPDQYLGQSLFDYEQSGKFSKLLEICETIYEKRERVLVFTQFKEMTTPISNFLETIFKRKGLVLHGGTPIKKRAALVETFCGEEYVPFMVLSLKAGGVGLNLTSANHVIHFDRWWNPAVENQATDRAFRIGQKKNVMVHKFITSGTIEEKIDMMIEQKQKLAGDIVASSGENWITEMNDDDIINLFTLG